MARARWAAAVVAVVLRAEPLAATVGEDVATPPRPSRALSPVSTSGNTTGQQDQQVIKEHIDKFREHDPDIQLDHSTRRATCYMSPLQHCPMSLLSESTPSLVYPGGNTSCLEGAPYAFRIYPGASDKLYIHFQGGGACWDQITTMWSRACKDGISTHPNQGIFNKTDPENPLKDFTQVMVIYCSGDMHAGGTKKAYESRSIVQNGYYNAMAALSWTKENFPGKLTQFGVGGASAGALASMIWAGAVLDMFHYDSSFVLLDSYMPILPKGADSNLFQNFEACGTLPLPEKYKEKCRKHDLHMSEVLEHQVVTHSNTTFAIINSKADADQMYFGVVMAKTMGVQNHYPTPETYYREVNLMAESLHSFPNVFTYIVGGSCTDCHVYTVRSDRFYNATAKGYGLPEDVRLNGPPTAGKGSPAQWLRRLLEAPSKAEDACEGEVFPRMKWESEEGVGIEYCPEPYLKEADIKAIEVKEEERQKFWHLPFLDGVLVSLFALVLLAGVWAYCRFRDPKDMCEYDKQEDDEDDEDESP